MDKMDLKKYGITGVTEIVYNPSYDELFREETKKGLRGFDKGVVTDMGAVNVMTGVYTGRSPSWSNLRLSDGRFTTPASSHQSVDEPPPSRFSAEYSPNCRTR